MLVQIKEQMELSRSGNLELCDRTLVQPNHHDWPEVPTRIHNNLIRQTKLNPVLFRSAQALGDIKRFFPRALHSTWQPSVYIPTLLVLDVFHIYMQQTDNHTQDNTLLLLIPGSLRLIHRLSWFKTQLKPSLRRMRADYLFKSGKWRVILSRWRSKHVRWNGNWIRTLQCHHLRVLLRVSRMGLWIKWGLFRSLQPSWGWERRRYEIKFYAVYKFVYTLVTRLTASLLSLLPLSHMVEFQRIQCFLLTLKITPIFKSPFKSDNQYGSWHT